MKYRRLCKPCYPVHTATLFSKLTLGLYLIVLRISKETMKIEWEILKFCDVFKYPVGEDCRLNMA
jgi:hypothetical protein